MSEPDQLAIVKASELGPTEQVNVADLLRNAFCAGAAVVWRRAM